MEGKPGKERFLGIWRGGSRWLPKVALILSVISLIACDAGFKPTSAPKVRYDYCLAGRVVNFTTGRGITGAMVTLSGADLPPVPTDVDGNYIFPDPGDGVFKVVAFKSGYTSGSATATVTESGAKVTVIGITRLSDLPNFARHLVVSSEDPVAVAAGGASIVIPPGALAKSLELTVAPLKANEIPPPPEGSSSVGAAVFGPRGITLPSGSLALITFPILFPLPVGVHTPLHAFNTETQRWRIMETLATVNDDGTISTEVGQLGTFSVFAQASIEEIGSLEEIIWAETLSSEAPRVITRTLPSPQITFPGELPLGVSREWVTSILEGELGISFHRPVEFIISRPRDTAALCVAISRSSTFRTVVEVGGYPETTPRTPLPPLEIIASVTAPEIRIEDQPLSSNL